jgi:acyl-CoA reductase-like NAD-dependent aldehyde dehydrogenase
VVFKGSELSPQCFYTLYSVFRGAGLPPGVLNYIVPTPANAPSISRAIISSPEVKKINFRGSTAVGRIIAQLAGEHLKSVLLELGGKAPAIVGEDADIDLAARACAAGSFVHSGQVCMSTERITVHKAVRAAFEQKLVVAVKAMFASKLDGRAVLISPAVTDKNRALIKDAVSKSAEVIYGTVEPTETGTTSHMQQIIIGNVSPDIAIYKTESFGPSVSIFEVETEEEALRIASDTEYGLTSAVFTQDLRRGLRMAKQIETGAVHINSITVHDDTALPHGGAKSSGFGRFGSAGLEEWVRTKNITFAHLGLAKPRDFDPFRFFSRTQKPVL